jgi:hypothetical protein
MKKVISFSLWGDNPNYIIGAIKNVELAQFVYPEFECWFYIHEETVPKETIEQLQTYPSVKIIIKHGDLSNNKPMMWRFEAIDDPEVEIMLSRDTDTRFTRREELAVNEWLNSDKLFHIMRDHPHHGYQILGGMFGSRKISTLPSWISIMDTFVQDGPRMYDQHFLRDYVYPQIVNNSIVHAKFHKFEEHAKDFPIDYDSDLRFVGEYIYADESRSQSHIDILIREL